jgi:hypothetical protein
MMRQMSTPNSMKSGRSRQCPRLRRQVSPHDPRSGVGDERQALPHETPAVSIGGDGKVID